MHFMAVKNVWKTFWFCGFSYSYLKDNSVFTVAKEIQSSKLDMWKGYYLSIDGMRENMHDTLKGKRLDLRA